MRKIAVRRRRPFARVRAHRARPKPNAQPIGPHDLILAAQALRLGEVVLTHQRAESQRAPD